MPQQERACTLVKRVAGSESSWTYIFAKPNVIGSSLAPGAMARPTYYYIRSFQNEFLCECGGKSATVYVANNFEIGTIEEPNLQVFPVATISISIPGVGGLLGEVAAELVEQLRALRLLAGNASAAALLPPARAGEHADDLVADLLGVGVEVEQDPGGDALVLAHEPEQDVLGADVVVTEGERLAQRELEDLLRPRRERNLAARDLVALPDDPRDLRPHFLHRDVEGLEHPRRETLFLAEQPEQDVLGADVVVLERPRLVLSEDDDLASPFGEAFEQSPSTPHSLETAGRPG